MVAALTVVIILAMSVIVVRVASVVLRRTGLPVHVARFQSISALTATGFTTGESEMITNYPVRRRVIAALMIIGNLGIVSLGATFVVTLVQTGTDTGAVALQVLWFAAALIAVWFFLGIKAVDARMCEAAGLIISRKIDPRKQGYVRTAQIADGVSVAEHTVKHGDGPLEALLPPSEEITVAAIRKPDGVIVFRPSGTDTTERDDTLVILARDAHHDVIAAGMSKKT